MSTNNLEETAVIPHRLRALFIVIFGSLLLSSALVFIVTFGIRKNVNKQVVPPPGFQSAAQIDLSARAYDAETVAQVTLDKATDLDVFLLVQNINTPYFDMSLSGPDGYLAVVLHGEDFRTDNVGASALQTFNLLPGEYRLVVTAAQSPGLLNVQWDVR